jgi:hypothetical protein
MCGIISSTVRKINTTPIVYRAKSGAIELRGDFEHETVWATQANIAEMFGVTPQNVTIHLKNIYAQKELSAAATCKEGIEMMNTRAPFHFLTPLFLL